MKRHLASGLLLAASLVAPAVAWTADVEWGTVGFVTSTLGNQSGRLCAGAPSTMRPGDFGCPSYAPSITTAGHVSVTGNLSAAQFVGDGSLLTGLNATGDRITSGTASVIVTSATSSISFSTAGSERMSILSNGNVGIGSSNPLAKLVVAGNVDITTGALNIFGGSILSAPATDIMLRPNNGVTALTVKASSGNVGIGTTNPQATLQVSGSFIVSTSAQTTTPSLFVGTNGNVGVGTSAPIGRFEVASGVVNNGGSTKLRLNNMASSVSSESGFSCGKSIQ